MTEPTITVYQTTLSKRAYKRLHTKLKADIDQAVAAIVRDPTIGEGKKGDLAGVYVYKFKCNAQETLLAYEYDPGTRMLLLLGSHENLHRDIKR